MQAEELTQLIHSEAKNHAFEWVGAAPAVEPPGFSRFEEWLGNGFEGEMHYLADRRDAYRNPQSVLDGAVSVVMLTLNYYSVTRQQSPKPGSGQIARYAWGAGDYHDLIHKKLKAIRRSIEAQFPKVSIRGVVDTAPLLEREFAQLAGLGWFGKNTMLINKRSGSWFFLAALLIDQPLVYDAPHATSHCGTCTACLTACPTDAFTAPGVLDATRCISYLTIEHRSPIPMDLRPQMGNWILGCDVCQDVCPWNRKAPTSTEPMFSPTEDQNPIDLLELFDLDDDSFRQRFRKSPLWRPKRRGILRNAAIALGNQPSTEGIPALEKGLNDEEPLVRGASAWALGRHAEFNVSQLLSDRMEAESDPMVRDEIQFALEAAKGR